MVPLITVETELYNLLKSHPTLQSLVGARVYPLVLPQGTALPAITFQRAGTMLRGRIGGPSVLSDRPGLYGVLATTRASSIWPIRYTPSWRTIGARWDV
ncbi:MAG: hypothetical protein C4292_02620 [Nitrososphaera sp.]